MALLWIGPGYVFLEFFGKHNRNELTENQKTSRSVVLLHYLEWQLNIGARNMHNGLTNAIKFRGFPIVKRPRLSNDDWNRVSRWRTTAF